MHPSAVLYLSNILWIPLARIWALCSIIRLPLHTGRSKKLGFTIYMHTQNSESFPFLWLDSIWGMSMIYWVESWAGTNKCRCGWSRDEETLGPCNFVIEECWKCHVSHCISPDISYHLEYRWTLNNEDLAWKWQSVTDAIVSLQFLRNIKLIFPDMLPLSQLPMDDFHLNQLSHLHKISIFGKCEDYQSLVVDGVAEAITKSLLLTYLKVFYCFY